MGGFSDIQCFASPSPFPPSPSVSWVGFRIFNASRHLVIDRMLPLPFSPPLPGYSWAGYQIFNASRHLVIDRRLALSLSLSIRLPFPFPPSPRFHGWVTGYSMVRARLNIVYFGIGRRLVAPSHPVRSPSRILGYFTTLPDANPPMRRALGVRPFAPFTPPSQMKPIGALSYYSD